MSTQAVIAKKTGTGYKSIYCYHDGYSEGVGAMLRRHYTDSRKVDALIGLGDISCLGKEIGCSKSDHGFGDAGYVADWTLAYHRDRREAWKDTKPHRFKTIRALETYAYGTAKYLYLYKNGKWETKVLW